MFEGSIILEGTSKFDWTLSPKKERLRSIAKASSKFPRRENLFWSLEDARELEIFKYEEIKFSYFIKEERLSEKLFSF